eukprot:CAMPEP_0182560172 /NCGR_PEP_ID=MMETSP1324-20130603/2987_1 /TAXON_ID=236786 /ORGANISM="Florenciella sp., Strain RCC1587" /LENGTH=96 /DNA_ID=CAMNT_0024772507 /DNA_START=1244 /DNA_END=1534 /DNA_ORIENTATION=-
MKVCLRVARRLLGLCRLVDTGVASASLPRRHDQSTYARHHRPNRDIYRDAAHLHHVGENRAAGGDSTQSVINLAGFRVAGPSSAKKESNTAPPLSA